MQNQPITTSKRFWSSLYTIALLILAAVLLPEQMAHAETVLNGIIAIALGLLAAYGLEDVALALRQGTSHDEDEAPLEGGTG